MSTVDDFAAAGVVHADDRVQAASGEESKGHLRQFQARLSERLRQAGNAPRAAKLGLMIGARRWLVDLAEAGEIVPLPSAITPVPLTADWFRGIVNLRGALFAVSDLRRFAGGAPTPVTRESRLLAFSTSLDLNAALLVSRMLGLHDPGGWREAEAGEAAEATETADAGGRTAAAGPAAVGGSAGAAASDAFAAHPVATASASSGSPDEPEGESADRLPAGAPWAGRRLVDAEGRVWQELSLARLAADERFLSASR